jgi:hypothetical protein
VSRIATNSCNCSSLLLRTGCGNVPGCLVHAAAAADTLAVLALLHGTCQFAWTEPIVACCCLFGFAGLENPQSCVCQEGVRWWLKHHLH